MVTIIEINSTSDQKGAGDLGTPAPDWTYIGVTLNFDPKIKITKDRVWGQLDPNEQINLFKMYLKDAYLPYVDDIWYSFEFTKNGEVHCHAIAIVRDKFLDWNLNTLRKKVFINRYNVRWNKGSKHRMITSNYIHLVDRDIWLQYIRKDNQKNPKVMGYTQLTL